jgi:hypothetical protein
MAAGAVPEGGQAAKKGRHTAIRGQGEPELLLDDLRVMGEEGPSVWWFRTQVRDHGFPFLGQNRRIVVIPS